MDFVNKLTSGGGNSQNQGNEQVGHGSSSGEQKQGGGGFLGGIGDKLNSAAGGGKESEKNEDYLDKGMPIRLNNPSFPAKLAAACFARLIVLHRRRLRTGEVPRPRTPGQRGMSSLLPYFSEFRR